MKIKMLILTILAWSIIGCSQELESPTNTPGQSEEENAEWLVPVEEVFDGGPGKDGIPSIDNPRFSKPADFTIMKDDDIIIAVNNQGNIKGYPHRILDWHEIVNDQVGSEFLSITYCPLTGTTLVWDRVLNGKKTTFGVSGLLYNSNLIPYDRASESYWSQILQQSIYGEMIASRPVQHPAVEMSWKTFKETFPDAEVLNINTGYSRNYSVYPYSDYKTNNDFFLFPRARKDDRIPQKERVLSVSIFENEPRIFRFSHFPSGGGIIEDEMSGRRFLVVGNVQNNYMVAFQVNEKGWKYLPENFPNVLQDPNGNIYNIFGESNSGNLELYPQLMGYWFTFPAFYENYDVHKG